MLGKGGIVRFGANRVELAVDFLAKEAEWSSHWLVDLKILAELGDVGAQASDLFAIENLAPIIC